MPVRAEQKSRLYYCKIFHSRVEPKIHRFWYSYTCFCIDLGEVAALSKKSLLFGTSAFSMFRFCTEDFIFGNGGVGIDEFQSKIREYVKSKGVVQKIDRIEILAHLRTLGYGYNPAAFYFCYGGTDEPICAILEITNTYKERKTFFIPGKELNSDSLSSKQDKHFYVSPFVALDSKFSFEIFVRSQQMRIQIDSYIDERLQVHSLLSGTKREFRDTEILKAFLRFPLAGLGVMLRIHFQALILYLKRIPFIPKKKNLELQKGGIQ